jgi:hypothetical protein
MNRDSNDRDGYGKLEKGQKGKDGGGERKKGEGGRKKEYTYRQRGRGMERGEEGVD